MAREMKNSGIDWIGEIPKGWEVGTVGMFFDEINNPNTNQEETNTLQFKMGDIISKKNGDSKYNPETIAAYNVVEPGTIMINGLNLSFDLVSQRVAQVHEKGAITSTYLAMMPKNGLQSDYAKYMLKAYDNCKALHSMGRGLRAILSYSSFRTEPIFLPPLSEQRVIANFLDEKCSEIDELVALQEKIIEELKAYKQAVITETVTKGLDPNVKMKDSGVAWIGEIPQHWSKDKIFRVFTNIGSGTTPKATEDSNFEGDINWIQSGDINGGLINNCKNKVSQFVLEKYSALKVYKAPFIIVAMYGASVGNISVSTIDGCVNQACCVMSDSLHCYDYLFYAIKSAKDYLIYKAEGGGQPNISQDKLTKLWLPLPPLSDQQAIATYLDTKCADIDALISIKQKKIDELKDYKKSLIYEYVTGKKQII